MVRAWVARWLLLLVLYLALTDTVAVAELVIGAVVAAIGATGAVLVRRHRRVVPRYGSTWPRAAWRPLIGLFTDLVPLTRALLARRGGVLVEVPFDDRGDEAEQAGRRALTEVLGSLAPGTIVVGYERGVVIEHRIAS